MEINTYTLVGFYPDNGQRWANTVKSTDPEAAEHLAPESVHICGVIAGPHRTVDGYPYVRMGGE